MPTLSRISCLGGIVGFRCFQHWIPWIHFIIVMFENNKWCLLNVFAKNYFEICSGEVRKLEISYIKKKYLVYSLCICSLRCIKLYRFIYNIFSWAVNYLIPTNGEIYIFSKWLIINIQWGPLTSCSILDVLMKGIGIYWNSNYAWELLQLLFFF